MDKLPCSFFISKFTCSKDLLLTLTTFPSWKTLWLLGYQNFQNEKKRKLERPLNGILLLQLIIHRLVRVQSRDWQKKRKGNEIGLASVKLSSQMILSSEITYNRCTHLQWTSRTYRLHFCGGPLDRRSLHMVKSQYWWLWKLRWLDLEDQGRQEEVVE